MIFALGPSWAVLGGLGRSWVALGSSWGALGSLLGRLGSLLGGLESLLGGLGSLLGRPGAVLERSWDDLGAFSVAPWAQKHTFSFCFSIIFEQSRFLKHKRLKAVLDRSWAVLG